MVEALRRHDVGGQTLCFGSFPAKTQVTSKEINTLSFTFHSVLHCFLTLPQCNVKTTLGLFHILNNGRQECKEMASRDMGHASVSIPFVMTRSPEKVWKKLRDDA